MLFLSNYILLPAAGKGFIMFLMKVASGMVAWRLGRVTSNMAAIDYTIDGLHLFSYSRGRQTPARGPNPAR